MNTYNNNNSLCWCIPSKGFQTTKNKIIQKEVYNFGFNSYNFYNSYQLSRFKISNNNIIAIGTCNGNLKIMDDINTYIESSNNNINNNYYSQTILPKLVFNKLHYGSIFDLNFTPNNAILGTSSNDRTINIINIQKWLQKYCCNYYDNIPIKIDHTFETEHSTKCLDFVNNFSMLTAENNVLKLYDLTKSQIISEYCQHTKTVTCIRSDLNIYFSGSKDRKLIIWSINDKKPLKIIDTYPAKIKCMDVIKYPCDYNIICGYNDSALICYSLAKECVLWQSVVHKSSIQSVNISKDGKLCLSSSIDGIISVNNTENGELICILNDINGNIHSEWNPNYSYFMSTDKEGNIKSWQYTI